MSNLVISNIRFGQMYSLKDSTYLILKKRLGELKSQHKAGSSYTLEAKTKHLIAALTDDRALFDDYYDKEGLPLFTFVEGDSQKGLITGIDFDRLQKQKNVLMIQAYNLIRKAMQLPEAFVIRAKAESSKKS